MNSTIFFAYYSSIVAAAIVGILRYRRLDTAFRVIAILLIITSISELAAYLSYIYTKYEIRGVIFHTYNVIQGALLTAYFIHTIKPYRYGKPLLMSTLAWVAIGVLNAIFLQPVTTLNTNVLIIESFCFITMSLYSIYRLLKNDIIRDLFLHPGFRFAVINLATWSSTLLFWATIKILYRNHWKHIQTMMDIQVIIGMLSYLATGATLFFYHKNKRFENL